MGNGYEVLERSEGVLKMGKGVGTTGGMSVVW